MFTFPVSACPHAFLVRPELKFPFSPFYHCVVLFGVHCIIRQNGRARFLKRTMLKVSRLFQAITIESSAQAPCVFIYRVSVYPCRTLCTTMCAVNVYIHVSIRGYSMQIRRRRTIDAYIYTRGMISF